jgi:hypothetical protein
METLGGFPYLPALWLQRAMPAYANASEMETLGGFPYLPALWLQRAMPAYANASEMETGMGLARGAPSRIGLRCKPVLT